MKIQKHLKIKKVGILLTNVSPLCIFRKDEVRITSKIQASVRIILNHHDLSLKPIEKTIVISDNRSCHMPSHELAPS